MPKSGTRPTSDRVREALFSRFESLTTLRGCAFLDLYAGSGAVGLEAASRGAQSVDFVDDSVQAARIITANIAAISREVPECLLRVHRTTAAGYLAKSGLPVDVAFIDPPYELSNDSLVEVIRLLVPRLAEDSVVAIERSARDPEPQWPEEYRALASKDYGETRLYWLERAV